MSTKANEPDRMLTSGEVAKLWGVDPKTVTRWAKAGKLRAVRTPGGHYRFRESEILARLNGHGGPCPTCRHAVAHNAFGCTLPDCGCAWIPESVAAVNA